MVYLAIVAAEKAAYVVAVDFNPYAIRCAKENSVLNNVRSKMTFIQSGLLARF